MKMEEINKIRKKVTPNRLLNNCLNGWWSSFEIDVFRWILATGKKFDSYTDGIHKRLYNYSALNHNSFQGWFRGEGWKPKNATNPAQIMLVGFTNAFVLKPYSNDVICRWRKEQGLDIKSDSFRTLEFIKDTPEKRSDTNRINYYCIKWEIWRMRQFVGRYLKKSMCHPDYKNRLNPYTKDIDFSVFAEGVQVRLDFTFDMKGYDRNAWTHYWYQRKNESTNRLFWRVNTDIQENYLDNRRKYLKV